MIEADRLKSAMDQRGLSQSELARRVGVTQTTIRKLLSGGYGSKHLHRIARELGTTPEYLTGEIDDPDQGAPLPPPRPSAQIATLHVLLPSEEALTRMFLGVLKASPRMSQDELALELAKSLPSGLQLLRGPLIYEDQDLDAAVPEVAEVRPSAGRARRRA